MWTTTPHGSWTSATTDTPELMPDALDLPGSWLWHRGAVLVRTSEVANLPEPPVPPDPPDPEE